MSKEIKILHIIDSLGLGGAQSIVKGIFEYQSSNQNLFLFAARNRDILIEVEHPNVQIFNSSKKYSFRALFVLRDLIKSEEITIVHCHLFKSQIFGFLLKKIWFRNIKLIFHEHGEIFQGHVGYNLFMKAAKNTVNKIIAVSNATKEKLTAKADIEKNKIVVLPNFVNLNIFNRSNITWNIEEEKNKLVIKKNEFVIGFVGRLANIKGCEYLIKALPFLSFPYKVLIVGNGPERNTLEYLVKKLELEDKVIFLGYRDDVLYTYSLLDVLVVPSISESFGLSVIEAQAIGIPVIASNIDGLSEIVKKTHASLLFEVKDYVDLADKIKILFSDKKIKTKAINDLYNVKKYSLNMYIKKLEEIYE